MKRARPEDEIQRAVFQHFDARSAKGAFAFAVPNGGWRSKIEASIMKGLGVKAGVPDIIAVHRGKVYALELKAPHGRKSDAQIAVMAALEAAGAVVGVSYGLNEALGTLERWGLLKGAAR